MTEQNIKYIKEFDEYCREWDLFLNQGNYKKANLYYKKIKNIYERISISDEKELFYLTLMNEYENIRTLSTACTQMLILGINIELAEENLRQISIMVNDKSSAVFSSKMVLQEWEKGNLMKF